MFSEKKWERCEMECWAYAYYMSWCVCRLLLICSDRTAILWHHKDMGGLLFMSIVIIIIIYNTKSKVSIPKNPILQTIYLTSLSIHIQPIIIICNGNNNATMKKKSTHNIHMNTYVKYVTRTICLWVKYFIVTNSLVMITVIPLSLTNSKNLIHFPFFLLVCIFCFARDFVCNGHCLLV